MNELEFKIRKDNKEIIYKTIATYHDDNLNKDFIIYTDNTYNDNNLNIYYAIYKIIDNNIKLIEIKNNKERKVALELVKEILKQE